MISIIKKNISNQNIYFFSKIFFQDKKYRNFLIIFAALLLQLVELIAISIIFPIVYILLNQNETNEFLDIIFNYFNETTKVEIVIYFSFFIISIYFLKSALSIFLNSYILKYSQIKNIEFKKIFFSKLIFLKYDNFIKKNYAYYLNIITSSLPYIIENFFLQVLKLVQNLIFIATIALYIFFLNPNIFLIVFLSCIILVFLFYKIIKSKVNYLGKLRQTLSEKIYINIQHSLDGIKDVKLSSKENYFINQYFENLKNISRVDYKQNFIQSLPGLSMDFIMITMIFSSFIFFISLNGLNFDNAKLIIILLLLLRSAPIVNQIIYNLSLIASSIDPLKNCSNFFFVNSNFNEMIEHFNEKTISSITLKKISYKYSSSKDFALKNFNLKVYKNNFVGIYGKNGSGKTTLANIISGLLKDYTGNYYINGKKIDSKNIGKVVSYVDQSPFFLDQNIYQNIIFSGSLDKKIDYNFIDRIIKVTGLSSVLKSKGKNFKIGKNGSYLSGGERQKLAIARAIYKNTNIMIFDEATASLDEKSEKEIMRILKNLQKDRIIFFITHKIYLKKYFSKTIFINEK